MIRTVLCLAGAILAVAGDVEACSCVVGTSPCEQFRNADAVFVGRVLDVHASPESAVTTARLQVIRAGKGVKTGETVTVTAPDAHTSCALEMRPGERWIVYAAITNSGLETHKCSGNEVLAASDPLPDVPPEPGSVRGVLTRERDDSDDEVAVAGVRVWVDGPHGRITARTGRNGWFHLRGLPAGRSIVRFDLPPGEAAEADVDLGSDEECATVRASVGPGGGIVGRVVDAAGGPLVDARVYILSADGGPIIGPQFFPTLSTGEFRLVGLWPGRYLLAVGLNEEPFGRFPYRGIYYPDAVDRGGARAIAVEDRIVQLEPFVMRSPLPVTTIAAEIVCRDGTRPVGRGVMASRTDGQSGRPDDSDTPGPDGRYLVRVVKGPRYRIEGVVEGRSRRPDGSVIRTIQATNAVETATIDGPGVVALTLPAERCDAPGGPWIERR